jgi:hypothetical protein
MTTPTPAQADEKALIAPPVTEEMLQAARDTLPVGFNDLCDADLEDIWEAMHRAAIAQPRPEEVEDEAVAGEDDEDPVNWYDVAPKRCARCGSDRAFLNSYLRPDSAEVCRVECPACGRQGPEHFTPEPAIVQWDAADRSALARPAPKPAGGVLKALRDLLDHVDRETCPHEDTHRGGLIWTVCDACGRKWADDEGGFVPYSDPPAVARARLICEASPAPANAAPASEREGA